VKAFDSDEEKFVRYQYHWSKDGSTMKFFIVVLDAMNICDNNII
jgi:hypothetical protein